MKTKRNRFSVVKKEALRSVNTAINKLKIAVSLPDVFYMSEIKDIIEQIRFDVDENIMSFSDDSDIDATKFYFYLKTVIASY